jgi:hypothetical protein
VTAENVKIEVIKFIFTFITPSASILPNLQQQKAEEKKEFIIFR